MRIRPIEDSDFPAVVELWRQSVLITENYDGLAELITVVPRNHDLCFVADLDGRIVGSVLGIDIGSGGLIGRLAVHPDQQRKGLGRKLVAATEEQFTRIGKRGAAILVHENNTEGRKFWASVGYGEFPELIEGWKYLDPNAIDDGGYAGDVHPKPKP